jgi:cbb3-type cytochrome oxidase subunit 3
MIQNVLHKIGGVENYGIISLCLFFLVFAGVLIWAFSRKKADLDSAAALPLEKDANESPNSENRYE